MSIMEITKEMTMGQILGVDPDIAFVLMDCGMHCVGCPSSIGESLADACMVHGLEADEVLDRIQSFLKEKNK